MRRISYILLVLLFLPLQAWAADYYVAETGADTNIGSSAAPFRNIPGDSNCADNCATAAADLTGDAVYLNRGDTWTVTVTVPSATALYDAYGTGDRPKIGVTGASCMSVNVASVTVRNIEVEGDTSPLINVGANGDGSVFDGLDISKLGGNFGIQVAAGAHNVEIKNCIGSSVSGSALVYGGAITGLSIHDNVFTSCQYGIVIDSSCTNCGIYNNTISNFSINGISAAGDTAVYDNVVGPVSDAVGNCIVKNTTGGSVYRNTVFAKASFSDVANTHEGIKGTGNADIFNNTIYHAGRGFWGTDGFSGKVYGNLALENGNGFDCTACNNAYFFNNVALFNDWHSFDAQSGPVTATYINNICWIDGAFPDAADMNRNCFDALVDGTSGVTVNYNIWMMTNHTGHELMSLAEYNNGVTNYSYDTLAAWQTGVSTVAGIVSKDANSLANDDAGGSIDEATLFRDVTPTTRLDQNTHLRRGAAAVNAVDDICATITGWSDPDGRPVCVGGIAVVPDLDIGRYEFFGSAAALLGW